MGRKRMTDEEKAISREERLQYLEAKASSITERLGKDLPNIGGLTWISGKKGDD